MKVELLYGKKGLSVSLPDKTKVIEPIFIDKLRNELDSIKKSITDPMSGISLKKSSSKSKTIGISVCDITRPMPIKKVLPVVLSELSEIKEENIKIFIANGTHRECTDAELENMLGKDVFRAQYQIINHDAFNENNLTDLGTTSSGIPVSLNSDWLNCDYKITIGLVEPHFFAGFSGGPKMVAPGLAGLETIMNLHDYDKINNKKSTWGLIEDNPIHKQISEISLLNKPDFSIDLTLNRENKITGIYSGELFSEHTLACQDVKKDSMKKTDKLYDLVITSNSGYPLDQNLYQSIKGVSAAAQITKPGGMIICVSECSDGIPFNSNYEKLLESVNTPEEYLLKLKEQAYLELDQWQVQVQAQIQENNKVMLYSKLNEKDVSKSHLLKINNIENVIEELKRDTKKPSICILPEGPQTIPYKI